MTPVAFKQISADISGKPADRLVHRIRTAKTPPDSPPGRGIRIPSATPTELLGDDCDTAWPTMRADLTGKSTQAPVAENSSGAGDLRCFLPSLVV